MVPPRVFSLLAVRALNLLEVVRESSLGLLGSAFYDGWLVVVVRLVTADVDLINADVNLLEV